MAEAPTDARAGGSGDPSGGRRLESWKEIAAYLKRDVATVRRWEKREALPVHRHLHEKLGSVYAYTAELEEWQAGRRPQGEQRSNGSIASRRAVLIALLAAIAVAAIVGAAYRFGEPDPIQSGRPRLRVSVHRPGTVANLVAEGLVDVLGRTMSGVDVEPVQMPGMLSTLRAIDDRQVDVGLAFNLLAFHAVKTEQVLGRRTNAITAMTSAYVTPAQIVVRADSDVRMVSDLKGRRIGIGSAESGERFCSRILLSHLGFDLDAATDQVSDFAPALNDVLEGRLDAYITWRGMPTPDVAEAFTSGRLRLVPLTIDSVEGLRVKHPFLVPWSIPARVYSHQESSVPTVGGRILLLASRSLSSDIVEQILRGIAAHLPDLIARHPAAADIQVKRTPTLEEGLSIDLHPGAVRFFQSVPER